MSNLITIKNLEAGYLPNKPVLKIDTLNIQKGKIIFILGKSGIGKSTLLELLGLMNNTIFSNAKTQLEFNSEEKNSVSYHNLWASTQSSLAAFRNRHFSFIFQNENLMHNFSAGENICFAQMIQGRSLVEAKNISLVLMDKLGIERDKFSAGISAFSGGQRQRLSFIRAISTDYSVLFGDEPTGNLDWQNANNLMTVLKEDMIEKNGAAIIVSHHIDLALAFADQLMLFTEKENLSTENKHLVIGEILDKHIYEKADWNDDKQVFKKHVEDIIK